MSSFTLQSLRSKYAITILLCGIVTLSLITFGNWNNEILNLKTNDFNGSQLQSSAFKVASTNIFSLHDRNATKSLPVLQNSTKKPGESKNDEKRCRCKKFEEITKSQIGDQKELDKIDPISGLKNRETIFKRHPNLGRQVLSEVPRCNLIPYITK